MKLGFDELYVITIDGKYLLNECLYDFHSAQNECDSLNAKSFLKHEVKSLECIFNKGYTLEEF